MVTSTPGCIVSNSTGTRAFSKAATTSCCATAFVTTPRTTAPSACVTVTTSPETLTFCAEPDSDNSRSWLNEMSRTEGCTRLALKVTTATTASRERRAPETTSVTFFFFGGTEREKGIETSKKNKEGVGGFKDSFGSEQLLSL